MGIQIIQQMFFDNYKIVFLIVSIFFIILSLIVPKIKFLLNFSLENLFILFSSLFLSGGTIGTRSGIPQKIKEQFRATGVVHVLALYGLHIQVL